MKIKLLAFNGLEESNIEITDLLWIEWNWELYDMTSTTDRLDRIKEHSKLPVELVYTNWGKEYINWKEVYKLWVESDTDSHYYLILEF